MKPIFVERLKICVGAMLLGMLVFIAAACVLIAYLPDIIGIDAHSLAVWGPSAAIGLAAFATALWNFWDSDVAEVKDSLRDAWQSIDD